MGISFSKARKSQVEVKSRMVIKRESRDIHRLPSVSQCNANPTTSVLKQEHFRPTTHCTPSKPQKVTMKVTIIGAGFSGSVLALSLKKQNPPIDSIIYEAGSKNTPVSGSVTLTANALRILDDIGLYNEIRLKGFGCERIHLYNQQLQQLGSLYNGDERNHGYQALRIKREHVRDVLMRQLEAQGIKVIYEMQCTKIEELPSINRVKVTFQTDKVVESEYVVSAEGIHSVVRRHVEKGSDARYQGSMNLGGWIEKERLPLDMKDINLPCVIYGSTGTISLIPSDTKGDEIGVFATADYQDLGDKGWDRIASEKDKLKVILGGVYCMRDWPKSVRDLVKSLDPPKLYSWP